MKNIILTVLCLCFMAQMSAQTSNDVLLLNPEWKSCPLVVYSPNDFESIVKLSFSKNTIPNIKIYSQIIKMRRWYDSSGKVFSAELQIGSDSIVGYKESFIVVSPIVLEKIKDVDSLFWFAFFPENIFDMQYHGVVKNDKISFYDKRGNYYKDLEELIVKQYGSLHAFEDEMSRIYKARMAYTATSGYNKFYNKEDAVEFFKNDYATYSLCYPDDYKGFLERLILTLNKISVLDQKQISEMKERLEWKLKNEETIKVMNEEILFALRCCIKSNDEFDFYKSELKRNDSRRNDARYLLTSIYEKEDNMEEISYATTYEEKLAILYRWFCLNDEK